MITIVAVDDLTVRSEKPDANPETMLTYALLMQQIGRTYRKEIEKAVVDAMIYGQSEPYRH